MVRFFLLVLLSASALFSLVSGGPMKVVFTLSCYEDPVKNHTAMVELWDYSLIGDHKFLTRIEKVPVDGKTQSAMHGDAHNFLFQRDLYFLKIVHNCHAGCAEAWSYYAINHSENEWYVMNKGGRGEEWRYTSSYNKERTLDLSYGHNYKTLTNRCL